MNYNDMTLAKLDLNLITALSALLDHRSVSDAACAVGRTQSAMSHSLARLRQHFRDPILVRDGWNMQLTPMAEQLRPQVADAARAAQALFEVETDFDPATTTRRIRIAAPDLCASLFSPFIGAVSDQAPGSSVAFVNSTNTRQAVMNSQAEIGLGFGHPKSDPNLVVHPLDPLDWCTFARAGHAYARRLDPESWAGARHIVVGQAGNSAGPVEQAVRKQGITRQILCSAPNFSAALSLAAESDALFTTLRPPFERIAAQLDLTPCAIPFPMPDAPAALMFRADHGDPFTRWLRDLCLQSMG